MSDTVEAGEKQFEEAITSGRALKRLQKMFIKQGVSAEVAEALCRFEAFPEYDPAYEKVYKTTFKNIKNNFKCFNTEWPAKRERVL